MSELQFSLIGVGALIIVGVYVFNSFQERKYRRIAEKSFSSRQEDVLLDESAETLPDVREAASFNHESRIEPVISNQRDEMPDEPEVKDSVADEAVERIDPVSVVEPAPEEEIKSTRAGQQEDRPAALLDETILYIVQIHPSENVVGTAALVEAIRRQGEYGKRVRWFGMNAQTGSWEEVCFGGTEDYHQIAATLQLADRSGPISDPDLAIFCSQVQTVADELVAVAEFPSRVPSLALAAALDKFCADVDVLIGANIITQNGMAFAATKVRAMAEAAGMKLQSDGAFHFFNDEGADLFSLANLDPIPFSAENIRQLNTYGVTFLFDVPRVADGVRVFNQMLMVARQMASSLGGIVVDDNRRPLTDAGVSRIKDQLAELYAKMEAQQIKSGSARALRLFS